MSQHMNNLFTRSYHEKWRHEISKQANITDPHDMINHITILYSSREDTSQTELKIVFTLL